MQVPTKRIIQQLGWLLICILVINVIVLSKSVFPQASTDVPSTISPNPTQTRNHHGMVDERLLEQRIILLNKAIDSEVADWIDAQLLFLDDKDPNQDIYLYINSPGGEVTAGMAIYDTIQTIRPDVVTINTGLSSSMAAVLLASGTKGKRLALSHSRIMINQPYARPLRDGQNIDLNVQAREVAYHKKQLNELLAKHTGQPIERIEKDTQTDFFMSATEAKEYGIIDEVIERIPFSPFSSRS